MPRAQYQVPAPNPSLTGPLVYWLLPQLLILGACSAGFLFSRAQPLPADRLTLHLTIAAQIILLFLLFPMLLCHWRAILVLCAGSGPFWMVGMILSGIGWPAMISPALYILLWMIALRLVRMNLNSTTAQLHTCTAATAWLGIGPLIWYMRAESGIEAGRLFWSPLTAGLSLSADSYQIAPFIFPVIIGLMASLIFFVFKRTPAS